MHQFTVDAYAAQHPGKPERRTIQSVGVHLIALYQALELGYDAVHIVRARRDSASKRNFVWLEPPPVDEKTMTVVDVVKAQDADAHCELVRAWAQSVWRHWSPHHDTVRAWAEALK